MDKFNAEIKQNIRGRYNIYIDYHGEKMIMGETTEEGYKILEYDKIENAVDYLEDKKRIQLSEVK